MFYSARGDSWKVGFGAGDMVGLGDGAKILNNDMSVVRSY